MNQSKLICGIIECDNHSQPCDWSSFTFTMADKVGVKKESVRVCVCVCIET